ncbi:MAG TPA: hypothetical protein VLU98_01170, partial [Methanomicrobiales archaeon]|nr:hypothetical protein [Methanomicrobiales archaeon]
PHPKLAGVTERSLPLFLKAMRTSLSRDLPDDPERFYAVSGEILKGCLSAFRGQGRYLVSPYPEEMKVLRGCLDTMGRAVNALTPAITRARERLGGLAGLTESLAQYRDAKRRAGLGRKEIDSLVEEARISGESLGEMKRALADLEKGDEYLAYREELARIEALGEERGDVARLYKAATATPAHLFRKGEKVASRKKDRDAVRLLHEMIELLDQDLPLPEDSASRIIPPAQKVISALVASGELPLKNRDEIDLLGVPERLAREIEGISVRFRVISSEIATRNEAVLSRPAFRKSRDLAIRLEGLEKRISLATNRLEIARRELQDLDASMKASLEDMNTRVAALSGRPVLVRDPDGS